MRLRLAGLVLALATGAGALLLLDRPALPLPPLAGWIAAHPDPRGAAPAVLERHARAEDVARRDDLLLLLAGLAVAGLVLALRPRSVGTAGSRLAPALAAGAVAVGLGCLTRSGLELVRDAERGTWTLADDGLPALAGPLTDTLRDWQRTLGPHDAVLLAGSQDYLLNVCAFALFPRPVYAVVAPLPPEVDADTVRRGAESLPAGQDAPARWLIDLDALAQGARATRPVLVRLSP